jgi:hypothetical protein
MMGKRGSWLATGLLGGASDISHRTDRVESRSTTFLAPNLHSCSPARVPLLSCRREVRVDQFIIFDQISRRHLLWSLEFEPALLQRRQSACSYLY